MKNLETIKTNLESCIAAQMTDISSANTHELAQAFDMLKDVAEAMYYCKITEAMDEAEYGKDYDENGRKFYTPNMSGGRRMPEMYRDMDRSRGRMYYTDEMRTSHESPYEETKRYYTESKHKNPNDHQENVRKLQEWMDEIEADVKGLISGMTSEERQMARQKIINLANTLQ